MVTNVPRPDILMSVKAIRAFAFERNETCESANRDPFYTCEVLPKNRSITALLPKAGHRPDPDSVAPPTVAVIVIMEPSWQPLIAPNSPV